MTSLKLKMYLLLGANRLVNCHLEDINHYSLLILYCITQRIVGWVTPQSTMSIKISQQEI